jgi:TetR/AcrR family transcriptional regulator
MTRVLIGDALVNEHERLQERMNQFYERVESSLKQSFRLAVSDNELPADFDAAARAGLVVSYVIGRWHRFAKSGFRKMPADGIDAQLPALLV